MHGHKSPPPHPRRQWCPTVTDHPFWLSDCGFCQFKVRSVMTSTRSQEGELKMKSSNTWTTITFFIECWPPLRSTNYTFSVVAVVTLLCSLDSPNLHQVTTPDPPWQLGPRQSAAERSGHTSLCFSSVFGCFQVTMRLCMRPAGSVMEPHLWPKVTVPLPPRSTPNPHTLPLWDKPAWCTLNFLETPPS